MSAKHIELISTGAELLSGRTANQHARVLGERLALIGCSLTRDTTLPDDRVAISSALRDALTRVDTVLLSGGLGPTQDDVTRDAVADWCGGDVVMSGEVRAHIQQVCQEYGLECTPARERQALIVSGAEVLPNPVGLAAGECLAHEGKTVFLLPGPPAEFAAVLDGEVIPRLKEKLGDQADRVEKLFLTTGMPEADILTMMQEKAFPPAGVEVAYCAAPGRVEIRLSTDAADAKLLAEAADGLRSILGNTLYAEERVSLEEAVAALMEQHGVSLSVAESCTGGLLGARLTEVAGCSVWFHGGVVAYADHVKARELGVSEDILAQQGAVSEPVAMLMAEGILHRFKTDFGIGVTGVAGPGGGTDEKPVGLVYIAVTDRESGEVARCQFKGSRRRVREQTVRRAIDLLRLRLLETPPADDG